MNDRSGFMPASQPDSNWLRRRQFKRCIYGNDVRIARQAQANTARSNVPPSVHGRC